jgi:SAM-dependent methyltransferase
MFTLGLIKLLVGEVLPTLPRKRDVVCLARSGLIPSNFRDIMDYLRNNGINPPLRKAPYTSRELFLDSGFSHYDDIDFVPDEGVTIVHDMNTPLPEHVKGYDLVVECGTMEHIFDVAQVFKNMIQLCEVGGTVFHASPLTWLNHGFYNFSLTLFYDVYRNNGFDDFNFWLLNWPQNYLQVGSSDAKLVQFTPSQILQPVGSDFLMVAFTAKKKKDQPFKNPIQAAYDPALKLNTILKNHGV